MQTNQKAQQSPQVWLKIPLYKERMSLLHSHVTDANPQVSAYTFYVNNSNMALNTLTGINKFTLTNVQRSQHYGSYKCVTHNDAGDGQSDAVVLNINGKSFLGDTKENEN